MNSDGSVRKAQQVIDGLDPADPIEPSTSTVSLAYDAFGRQIRDAQSSTLDGESAPEFKMEYDWFDSGALHKTVHLLLSFAPTWKRWIVRSAWRLVFETTNHTKNTNLLFWFNRVVIASRVLR